MLVRVMFLIVKNQYLSAKPCVLTEFFTIRFCDGGGEVTGTSEIKNHKCINFKNKIQILDSFQKKKNPEFLVLSAKFFTH